MIRLWHDDLREAPAGWVWARTNEEAQRYLLTGEVVEISLDHDLGYHGVDLPEDPDALIDTLQQHRKLWSETGLDLVRWMTEHELVPEKVTIHSWNPPGARAMEAWLSARGYECTVTPYQVR